LQISIGNLVFYRVEAAIGIHGEIHISYHNYEGQAGDRKIFIWEVEGIIPHLKKTTQPQGSEGILVIFNADVRKVGTFFIYFHQYSIVWKI
jgi:hypothetical protein